MKLVQLYLIGVFIMIAFLVGSTMWQYQQFQTNVKNLQLGLPQQLTNSMPNANDQLTQMMGQIQGQLQTQNQTPPNDSAAAAATSTKTYTAPDDSFSFNYPSDWAEIKDQPLEQSGEKILFYANSPDISTYMAVSENATGTVNQLIEKYKQGIWTQNNSTKISEYQIPNNQIKILELEMANNTIPNININSKIKTAIFPAKNKIYQIVFITIDNKNNNEENDAILQSIKIKND